MIARVLPILASLPLVLLATIGAIGSDLNEEGKAAYARGDYVAADRLFSQALARAPRDPLLHYHRGVTLMRLSRWKEAAAAFEAALRLQPSSEIAALARQGLASVTPLISEPVASHARQDETSVRVRRVGGNWFAEVRINDTRKARFLVDTGASTCVISPGLAKELGIQPEDDSAPVEMRTISGRTTGRVVKIPLLQVGDVEAEGVLAVVHPIGVAIDGILGNTFLSRFTVTLDPAKGLLTLLPR
jgi:clan AA aspartic protease (TIGR02281 family)